MALSQKSVLNTHLDNIDDEKVNQSFIEYQEIDQMVYEFLVWLMKKLGLLKVQLNENLSIRRNQCPTKNKKWMTTY